MNRDGSQSSDGCSQDSSNEDAGNLSKQAGRPFQVATKAGYGEWGQRPESAAETTPYASGLSSEAAEVLAVAQDEPVAKENPAALEAEPSLRPRSRSFNGRGSTSLGHLLKAEGLAGWSGQDRVGESLVAEGRHKPEALSQKRRSRRFTSAHPAAETSVAVVAAGGDEAYVDDGGCLDFTIPIAASSAQKAEQRTEVDPIVQKILENIGKYITDTDPLKKSWKRQLQPTHYLQKLTSGPKEKKKTKKVSKPEQAQNKPKKVKFLSFTHPYIRMRVANNPDLLVKLIKALLQVYPVHRGGRDDGAQLPKRDDALWKWFFKYVIDWDNEVVVEAVKANREVGAEFAREYDGKFSGKQKSTLKLAAASLQVKFGLLSESNNVVLNRVANYCDLLSGKPMLIKVKGQTAQSILADLCDTSGCYFGNLEFRRLVLESADARMFLYYYSRIAEGSQGNNNLLNAFIKAMFTDADMNSVLVLLNSELLPIEAYEKILALIFQQVPDWQESFYLISMVNSLLKSEVGEQVVIAKLEKLLKQLGAIKNSLPVEEGKTKAALSEINFHFTLARQLMQAVSWLYQNPEEAGSEKMRRDHLRCRRILSAVGIDLKVVDEQGNTLLHDAFAANYTADARAPFDAEAMIAMLQPQRLRAIPVEAVGAGTATVAVDENSAEGLLIDPFVLNAEGLSHVFAAIMAIQKELDRVARDVVSLESKIAVIEESAVSAGGDAVEDVAKNAVGEDAKSIFDLRSELEELKCTKDEGTKSYAAFTALRDLATTPQEKNSLFGSVNSCGENSLADDNGDNPLAFAVLWRLTAVRDLLLAVSPELVEGKNKRNESVLHIAASQGDAETCRVLIMHAEQAGRLQLVNAVNNDGETALDLVLKAMDRRQTRRKSSVAAVAQEIGSPAAAKDKFTTTAEVLLQCGMKLHQPILHHGDKTLRTMLEVWPGLSERFISLHSPDVLNDLGETLMHTLLRTRNFQLLLIYLNFESIDFNSAINIVPSMNGSVLCVALYLLASQADGGADKEEQAVLITVIDKLNELGADPRLASRFLVEQPYDGCVVQTCSNKALHLAVLTGNVAIVQRVLESLSVDKAEDVANVAIVQPVLESLSGDKAKAVAEYNCLSDGSVIDSPITLAMALLQTQPEQKSFKQVLLALFKKINVRESVYNGRLKTDHPLICFMIDQDYSAAIKVLIEALGAKQAKDLFEANTIFLELKHGVMGALIHYAALHGSSDMLNTMLTKSIAVDLGAQDTTQNTPLHLCCYQDEPDTGVIHLLLEAGAYLHRTNADNESPLTLLMEKPGYVEFVKRELLLICQSAERLSLRNRDGESLGFHLVAQGQLNLLQAIAGFSKLEQVGLQRKRKPSMKKEIFESEVSVQTTELSSPAEGVVSPVVAESSATLTAGTLGLLSLNAAEKSCLEIALSRPLPMKMFDVLSKIPGMSFDLAKKDRNNILHTVVTIYQGEDSVALCEQLIGYGAKNAAENGAGFTPYMLELLKENSNYALVRFLFEKNNCLDVLMKRPELSAGGFLIKMFEAEEFELLKVFLSAMAGYGVFPNSLELKGFLPKLVVDSRFSGEICRLVSSNLIKNMSVSEFLYHVLSSQLDEGIKLEWVAEVCRDKNIAVLNAVFPLEDGLPLLHTAVQHGAYAVAREMILAGASPNGLDKTKNNLLHALSVKQPVLVQETAERLAFCLRAQTVIDGGVYIDAANDAGERPVDLLQSMAVCETEGHQKYRAAFTNPLLSEVLRMFSGIVFDEALVTPINALCIASEENVTVEQVRSLLSPLGVMQYLKLSSEEQKPYAEIVGDVAAAINLHRSYLFGFQIGQARLDLFHALSDLVEQYRYHPLCQYLDISTAEHTPEVIQPKKSMFSAKKPAVKTRLPIGQRLVIELYRKQGHRLPDTFNAEGGAAGVVAVGAFAASSPGAAAVTAKETADKTKGFLVGLRQKAERAFTGAGPT